MSMAAGDFLSSLGLSEDISFGSLGGNFLYNLAIFFIIAMAVGIITYFVMSRKSYTKKLVSFKRVGGVPVRVGFVMAREITLPFTSVKAFQTSKGAFFPRPSIEMAKDEFWYWVKPDGTLINFGLEDFDAKMKRLKIYADHSDARLQNASLKKLVEKNYKKGNWLKEYGPMIAFGFLIFILGLVSYLLLTEAGKLSGSMSSVAEGLKDSVEAMNGILNSLETLETQSGLREIG